MTGQPSVRFAAIGLNHGHIYGQVNLLLEAGAQLTSFYAAEPDLAAQFYRFYRALAGGAELPVTLAEARASLELITAVYHSARTGGVVTLPIDPGHRAYAGWKPE